MSLEMIDRFGNFIIGFLGAAALIVMIWNTTMLSGSKARIGELLSRKNRKYIMDAALREIREEEDEDAAITPDTVRAHETGFNSCCSVHTVYSQLIPVFPLLGILGTVAGLLLAAQAKDINKMIDALGTAMSTTFTGLICAIVLKIVDAVCPSRIISDVEVMLDDYHRKIDLAQMYERAKIGK